MFSWQIVFKGNILSMLELFIIEQRFRSVSPSDKRGQFHLNPARS